MSRDEWGGDDFDKEVEYVTILDVLVKAKTTLAILVEIEDKEHWIPKSQLGPYNEVTEEGDKGNLEIPEWLADEKGI